MEGWIDILEYAAKYGVSASTLRRRIRANSIQYKLERGKYMIPDTRDVIEAAPLFSRAHGRSPQQNVRNGGQMLATEGEAGAQEVEQLQNENRRLKSQIAELETLVKALEAEVSRDQNATPSP